MNDEAAKLALADPGLVLKGKRNLLMEKAKKAVLESGFEFAKGKSRSKQVSSSDSTPPTPKRKKISTEFRAKHIRALEDEIKEQLKFKSKPREQAESTKSYRLCEDITEEIRCMRRMINTKSEELSELRKKDSKALWYQKRKGKVESSSHSDSAESLSSAGSTVILSGSEGEGSGF